MRTRRLVAARALLNVVRGARRPGAPSVGEQLAAVPRLVLATLAGRYPGMSRGRLVMMAAGLLYVLSPVDVVPELLLAVFGLADDALVAAWLAGTVLAEAESFLGWEAERRRVVRGEVMEGPGGRA